MACAPSDAPPNIEPADHRDEAALHAVRAWTFKPATRNGTPIRVRTNVELPFRLF